MHDVFLIDQDFRIERPTRYYRQGLNLLTLPEEQQDMTVHEARRHMSSKFSSIRTSFSKVFHRSSHSQRGKSMDGNGTTPGPRPSRPRVDSDSSLSSNPSTASRPVTPLLDPSPNMNPLQITEEQTEQSPDQTHKKSKSRDVSKHTFYVENSQVRLKLLARNEVGVTCEVGGYEH